jgi:DNA-binding response OmpR family regulator
MRILIVEDQPELKEFLKSSLEADFFAVDAESDGEKAYFLAKTNDYDLIILDNNLPNKTGAEICADIRKSKKNVAILILSVEAQTKKRSSF